MIHLLFSLLLLFPQHAGATSYVSSEYDVKLSLTDDDVKSGDLVSVKVSYTTDSEMDSQQLHAPYYPSFLEFVPSKSSPGCTGEGDTDEIRCYRKKGDAEKMTATFRVIAMPCTDIVLPMRADFWVEDYGGDPAGPAPIPLTIRGTDSQGCLHAADMSVEAADPTLNNNKVDYSFTVKNDGPASAGNATLVIGYDYRTLVLRSRTARIDGKTVPLKKGKRWCNGTGEGRYCWQDINVTIGTLDVDASSEITFSLIPRRQQCRITSYSMHLVQAELLSDTTEIDDYDNFAWLTPMFDCPGYRG